LVAANPLEHVVQHALAERPADLGFLTPNKVVTLMSDQIVMMIAAAVLLMLIIPAAVRHRRGSDEIGRHLRPTGGNFLEAICQYLRKDVAEPLLGQYTDRFMPYLWSLFFFVLAINILGLLPVAPLFAFTGLHIGGTATAN